MNPGILKLALVMAAMVLATGPALKAQGPKTAVVAPKPKATTQKPAQHAPNYMLGEAPPVTKPTAKALKSKSGSPKKSKKIPYEKCVNLNSVSKEELKKLPGITDVYAAKIIAGRPYRSKAALVTNQVIPSTVYFAIKDKVTAGKSPSKP